MMPRVLLLFAAWALTAIAGEVPLAPPVIYTYDARPLNRLDLSQPGNAKQVWDTLHLISALQGLANRDKPQFYLFYCSGFDVDTDQFWFDWLRSDDGWLTNASVMQLDSVEQALLTFANGYQGLVVYDPQVPATALAASTAAGIEDLLPVRYDPDEKSSYTLLTKKLNIPVKLRLLHPDGSPKFTGQGTVPDSTEASSGSAKIDVYRWMAARYLKPGRSAPGIAAYYIDSFWLQHPQRADPTMHTLSNHDYFVAHRALFFDLSPWADEAPGDDPKQPAGLDKQELLALMRELYQQTHGGMIKIGGFTPWPFKYTSHSMPAGKHDGVPTEWEYARLISQYNGYMEADAAGHAAMANASFFQHYPLKTRYPQPNPKPGVAEWRSRALIGEDRKVASKLFVGHYVGDYDAPSWLYKAVPAFFRHPGRGTVPLGWAFDPNLADRVPQALAYAYRYASSNDFFIAGDSGAGYLNPRALTVRPDSGLPSGLARWTEHCRRYYDRWGMSITGFILDGAAGASTDAEFKAYAAFSPDGAGTHFEDRPQMHFEMPTCREQDLPDDVKAAAQVIGEMAQKMGSGPHFLWARSILKSPRWYAELRQATDAACPGKVVYVDPYTFFGLIHQATADQAKNARGR